MHAGGASNARSSVRLALLHVENGEQRVRIDLAALPVRTDRHGAVDGMAFERRLQGRAEQPDPFRHRPEAAQFSSILVLDGHRPMPVIQHGPVIQIIDGEPAAAVTLQKGDHSGEDPEALSGGKVVLQVIVEQPGQGICMGGCPPGFEWPIEPAADRRIHGTVAERRDHQFQQCGEKAHAAIGHGEGAVGIGDGHAVGFEPEVAGEAGPSAGTLLNLGPESGRARDRHAEDESRPAVAAAHPIGDPQQMAELKHRLAVRTGGDRPGQRAHDRSGVFRAAAEIGLGHRPDGRLQFGADRPGEQRTFRRNAVHDRSSLRPPNKPYTVNSI